MQQRILFGLALTAALWISGIVASCGDDGGDDNKTNDTETGDDTDTQSDQPTETDDESNAGTGTSSDSLDDSNTADGNGTDGGSDSLDDPESVDEVPECKSQGFAPTVETARVSNIYGVEYLGFSSDSMPYDQVIVRMKMVGGAYPETGTYPLEGADINKCTNCVIAGKGCGEDGCEKLYVGTFGDIVAESIGPYKKPMKGMLNGVVMEEVDQNPQTGATSVKPGGDVWCLDGFEYDAQVLSFAEGTCPRPGVNCVGETVPDFTMTSCETGKEVHMADVMAGKKAMLYVLVTGWCIYCKTWMPKIVPYADALLDDGLEVAYVYGENATGGAPNQTSCSQYANTYSKHSSTPLVSKFYYDHDGVSGFANFMSAMWFYPTADGAFGTPFNAIVDAETSEYAWYGAGEVGTDAVDSIVSDLLGL